MAAIRGSVTKLTNSDHTAKGAAAYRIATIATRSVKNTVHATVMRRV